MKTTEKTDTTDPVVQRRDVAWNLVLITLLVAALAVVLLSMAEGGRPTGSTETERPATPDDPSEPTDAPVEPPREAAQEAMSTETPGPTDADKPPRTRVDRLVEMLCPVDPRRRAAESIRTDVPRLEHLRKLQSRCTADQAGLFGDDQEAPAATPEQPQTEKGTRP